MEPQDGLVPGTVVGEYRIEHKLGEGGMATVYSAFHPIIHKRVAIKVLNAEFSADEQAVERFVLEAQAVNLIHHPNIVDVYAFGKLEDGRSYLVMEYLFGRTLGDQLFHGPAPSIADTCRIMLGICDALEAAHEKGVVHRDLKPENVYLTQQQMIDGQVPGYDVKLLDFGIAKLLRAGNRISHPTVTGLFVGTPGYVAPEQARGQALDGRADLYALGVVAYEMFTGKMPYTAPDSVALVFKQLEEKLVPPSVLRHELPPALDALVVALMSVDPNDRPALCVVRQVLRNELGAQGNTPMPLAVFPSKPNRIGDDAARGPTLSSGELMALLPVRPLQRYRTWVATAVVMAAMASGWFMSRVRMSSAVAHPKAALAAAPVFVAPVAATPPAPVVKPETASLTVRASAGNKNPAKIEIDNQPMETGTARSVSVGAHKVVVSANGHIPVTRRLTLTAGQKRELAVKLKPASRDYVFDPFGKKQ